MDALADLVFGIILKREAELLASIEEGCSGQEELEIVRALLRLIASNTAPAPPSHLQ
jgi:hypothetical protein